MMSALPCIRQDEKRVQNVPDECAVLPLNRTNGRSEGLKGNPLGFLMLRLFFIARGAFGNENPAKPPDAALSVHVLWALRA